MENKSVAAVLSSLVLLIYAAVVVYVFFGVLHIHTLDNFAPALTFELIGFLALGFCILGNLLSGPMPVGFLAPLILITVVYTIAIDVVNFAFAATLSHTWFTLIHIVILFVYCLISVPMYVMGRR